MGAWGAGAFDNDGAGDLVAELVLTEAAGRSAVISGALRAASDSKDSWGSGDHG